MISRSHRFHGHHSLNHVYRSGQAARFEAVTLRFARSRRSDYRLAVVVSRKVSKSAVTRNRIRRRIYESVRLRTTAAGAPCSYDFVITVFDERLARLPADQLATMLDRLFAKAGVKL